MSLSYYPSLLFCPGCSGQELVFFHMSPVYPPPPWRHLPGTGKVYFNTQLHSYTPWAYFSLSIMGQRCLLKGDMRAEESSYVGIQVKAVPVVAKRLKERMKRLQDFLLSSCASNSKQLFLTPLHSFTDHTHSFSFWCRSSPPGTTGLCAQWRQQQLAVSVPPGREHYISTHQPAVHRGSCVPAWLFTFCCCCSEIGFLCVMFLTVLELSL